MAPNMSPMFEAIDENCPMLITPRTSMDSLTASIRPPHAHEPSLAAEPSRVDPDHPAVRGGLTPPVNCPASKVLNFSPGPTNLPPAVEAEVQRRCFPAPHEKRLGSMALSHRSPEFGSILRNALAVSRDVMQIPPEYEVLFTQGGGHGQFAAVPMNLCSSRAEPATYVVNGTWSKRAVDEAAKYCNPTVISSMELDGSCTSFPSLERINAELNPASKFLYVCSNETVNGLELARLPRLASSVPLVVDASSDFTSKPVQWREANVGLLFACASKNIGHPGITMVVVRRDLLGWANPFTPGILNYETNLGAGNVWNTIPTFNVDVVGIVMEWLRDNGGISAAEEVSVAKSGLVYDLIDSSGGFYGTPVLKESGYRSRMNVPFCVADGDESLTDLFLVECWERGIVGLRTVTPFGKSKYLRASLYHGVSYDETVVLVLFMKEFAERHAFGQQAAPSGTADEGMRITPTASPVVEPALLAVKDEFAAYSPSEASALVKDDFAAYLPSRSSLLVKDNFFAYSPSGASLLSTSPDSVMDASIQTMPKSFKMNEYSRVTDLFIRVPTPPALLR